MIAIIWPNQPLMPILYRMMRMMMFLNGGRPDVAGDQPIRKPPNAETTLSRKPRTSTKNNFSHFSILSPDLTSSTLFPSRIDS